MTMSELYDNPWFYNDEPILEVPKGYYGFVYLITNLATGKKYVGRKYFYQKRTPKGKKRKVTSESDWKKYYGSCKELKEDISLIGEEFFKREILCLCETMGQTNYKEIEYQFKLNVLFECDEYGNRLYYNGNIMSRYFAPKDTFDEQHRQKISDALKLHYEEYGVSEQKKLNQSVKMKLWWESRDEIQREMQLSPMHEAARKYTPTQAVRGAISEKLKGRSLSQEHKENMKGRTPWNVGIRGDDWKNQLGDNYKAPPTAKDKMFINNGEHTIQIDKNEPLPDGYAHGRLKAWTKRVRVIFADGAEMEFDSAKETKAYFKMQQKVFDNLIHRWDDEEYQKKRRSNTEIRRILYI